MDSGGWTAGFVRRTLCTWALLNAVYGGTLAAIALWLVPWKTPWVNVVLLGLALLHGGAAPGLCRMKRWAWRIGIVASLFGICVGCATVIGLWTSWAYLQGIYGDFGYGTAIAALGIAGLAFGVLGLFPALELRALWRREVCDFFDVSFSGWPIGMIAFVAAGLLIGLGYGMAWMPEEERIPEDAARAATRVLQAALKEDKPNATHAVPAFDLKGQPLYLTVWHHGVMLERFVSEAPTLDVATLRLAKAMTARKKKFRQLVDLVLRFDYVLGSRRVFSGIGPLLALSLRPGVEGLRATAGGASRALLPDDFVRADAFGAAPIIAGIDELRLGFDVDWAFRQLRLPHGTPVDRIRTQSWLFDEALGYRALRRGNTQGPRPSQSALRKAAVRAGDFVLGQISPEHMFRYVYFPYANNTPSTSDYSLARHAGTVYSLMLLYERTQLDRFRQGAADTLGWLMSQVHASCGTPDRGCFLEERFASLGSAALGAVAALSYQKQTHDMQFQAQSRALLAFILSMQHDDGEFSHVYNAASGEFDANSKSMFSSEEAALALVLGYRVLNERIYLAAAEKALNYLTEDKYRFFLGWFIYGADHWTCIAADEAWPDLKHDRYLDFCRGYAAFMRRLQYPPVGGDNHDFAGHYGFGAWLVPQAGAAAGFTEALISTYRLGLRHGVKDPALARQIRLGLSALLREQLRADNSYLVEDPSHAAGGFRRSLVESEMRIDFTQHALSALIRGSELSLWTRRVQ
ncbi:MAG: hypothetical protein H6714_10990 [Myxococcales bacterium]|nr:hypothetical protein [Myxococcales bacterium]